MVIAEIVIAVGVVLSLLSLISLKLSLANGTPYITALTSNEKTNESDRSCSDTLRFLMARFTLWEMFAVRQAKYKLDLMASWSLMGVINVLCQARWWGWSLGSILSMMGFLIAEMYIYKVEKTRNEIAHKKVTIDWRRPVLYSAYSILAVIGFCIVMCIVLFTPIPTDIMQDQGISFGVNIAIDQLVGRPLLILLITAISHNW
jgi:hypothetical protein